MSGSHYHISYNQILESERRLQLSNILKVFAIKYGSTNTEYTVSLKEFLAQFSDNVDSISDLSFDIEFYIHKLSEIFVLDFEIPQI